jgi:hypothetical protein
MSPHSNVAEVVEMTLFRHLVAAQRRPIGRARKDRARPLPIAPFDTRLDMFKGLEFADALGDQG